LTYAEECVFDFKLLRVLLNLFDRKKQLQLPVKKNKAKNEKVKRTLAKFWMFKILISFEKLCLHWCKSRRLVNKTEWPASSLLTECRLWQIKAFMHIMPCRLIIQIKPVSCCSLQMLHTLQSNHVLKTVAITTMHRWCYLSSSTILLKAP